MTGRLRLALLLAVAACAKGGDRRPAYLAGEAGVARIVALGASGEFLGAAAAAPALVAPVRALALRADGAVVALEETDAGAPPGVVLSPSGDRVATLDAVDGAGAPLFDAASRPWAAAEGPDGRIWVTGRPAPVLFRPDGSFAGLGAALPLATRGIAALPDGRMLVTYGAHDVALYAADGGTVTLLGGPIGLDASYLGLDAIALRPDGTFLVAALHHGVTTDGVLVAAALTGGALVVQGDAAASARLPTLPSAIAVGKDEVIAGPAIGALAPLACAERVSADLAQRRGCLAPGAQRGVAALPGAAR